MLLEKETLPKIREETARKNDEFEDKLLQLEMHHRKQNLLIYGVGEGAKEDIYATVYEVLAYFLQIPLGEASKIPLVNAHRLPSPQRGIGKESAPRPIIIRFVCMADRDRLLGAFEHPHRRRPQQPPQAEPAHQVNEPPHRPQQTPEKGCYDRVTIRSDLPPPMKRERGRLATLAYKIRKEKQLSTRIRINGTKLVLQTRKPARNGSPLSSWINWEN